MDDMGRVYLRRFVYLVAIGVLVGQLVIDHNSIMAIVIFALVSLLLGETPPPRKEKRKNEDVDDFEPTGSASSVTGGEAL